MTDSEKIIDALLIDRALALRFLATFSRFEYSLKRSNFLKSGVRAEPDWDGYANTLRGQFESVQDSSFREATAFLLKEPPKTQIVSSQGLDWQNTTRGDGQHDERYILRLVQTVRNNLFHGGKYPLKPVEDVGRNKKLLEASIIVLDQCLKLSQDLRDVFYETA